MRYLFQYRRYRLPFKVAVRTAHGWWGEREGVIVRLQDETGAVGYGEAAVIPWFGTETADEAAAGFRALGSMVDAEQLLALDPRLVCLRHALVGAWGELPEKTPHADRETAGRGDPASLVPPGTSATKIPYLGVAALLPAGRAARAEIAVKAEAGFRVFKWKVGVADLADELVMLDDVCAALPSGAKLRLDANGAWDRRQAERWLERCADCPVEFVEQPIPADARGAADLLLGLAGDFPTPIALDESLVGESDIERWIGAGWPGIFVVKPSLLAEPKKALERLAAANAEVVFSSALETAIGVREALRLAFGWANRAQRSRGSTRTDAEKPVQRSTGTLPKISPEPKALPAAPPMRALGFGVGPLFLDHRFDGIPLVPFVRAEDVEYINPEDVWNALS